MPIYEYSCSKCGQVIERIQKFSDPPLKRHPGCGGTLTKLVSRSAFQLKGTGWYVTDYAKKTGGKGKEGKEGKEGKDGGESGSTSQSDAENGKTSGKKEKTDNKADSTEKPKKSAQ
jgi:putative FmdB family regulatory protein